MPFLAKLPPKVRIFECDVIDGVLGKSIEVQQKKTPTPVSICIMLTSPRKRPEEFATHKAPRNICTHVKLGVFQMYKPAM